MAKRKVDEENKRESEGMDNSPMEKDSVSGGGKETQQHSYRMAELFSGGKFKPEVSTTGPLCADTYMDIPKTQAQGTETLSQGLCAGHLPEVGPYHLL